MSAESHNSSVNGIRVNSTDAEAHEAGSVGTPTADSPDLRLPRVLVLLCTYNERQNLPVMLTGLWQAWPQADILVLDDNSPDGTGAWALQQQSQLPKLDVIVRSGKLGLGSALRDGIARCLAGQYDYLVNLDADQSHDPSVLAELLTPCLGSQSESVVSIGSRYTAGGATLGLNWWRRFISRLLNGYATTVLRLPVHDCSGSYRCYPVRLLRQLDLAKLHCAGYGFLEEILVHLQRLGARFEEVPITYHARGSGSSKLSLGDVWGALWTIHRLAVFRP
jgi:dolichol-phosphate mannosyltransferase